MHLVVLVIAVCINAVNTESRACVPDDLGLYDSPESCKLKEIQSKPLRVVYLDKQYVTQNSVVISKLEQLNQSYKFASTCEKHETAIPEW
jgi:hypothetical protein